MGKRRAKLNADNASGLQDVIDSAEEFLESVRDQQGAAVDRLRERVSATMGAARDRLKKLDLPEAASDAMDSTADFLRSDPWRTVAIGALAALAISLLMHLGDD